MKKITKRMYNLISESGNVFHHRHTLSVLVEFLESVNEIITLEIASRSNIFFCISEH